ncbi:MAG: HPP family protein [Chloroflexi bacterium]|nr:HPP family protein [Chloroflexota bacterium]
MGMQPPGSSRHRRSLMTALFGNLIDRNLPGRAHNYIFQCGLASLSLFLILLVEDAVFRAAIVVAVASTAFTIFVFPNSIASTPRRIIGGHVIAVVSGAAMAAFLLVLSVDNTALGTRFVVDIAAALSVGLGALLMVITNTEHPPAAGTAFALVIYPWSWSAIVFIISSAIILSIVRIILRPMLINLL